MFLRFKSDNVPRLTPLPLLSPSPPALSPFQFSTYSYLLTSLYHPLNISFSFSIKVFALFPFPLFLPCHVHDIFRSCCTLFSFCASAFFPPLLCFDAPLPLQYLCVRGHCCGCKCPALSRRQSTKQGRGVRTHCSQATVCTSCPGPPIEPTCCMSTPPGKTSNRAEPPPPTSEFASHRPG